MFRYWRGRSIAEIAQEKMPPESIAASKTGLFTIGAPGTGIGHVIVNYKRVLQRGLEAIIEDIRAIKESAVDDHKRMVYEAMEIELRAAIEYAERFADLAERMTGGEEGAQRREELL